MADNVTTQSSTLATIPASTKIATDEDATNGHVQIVKLAVSTDGSATPLTADNTDGLLVDLGSNNDVTFTKGSKTVTKATPSTSSASVLAANASRISATIRNFGSVTVYLSQGTATTDSFPLEPGETLSDVTSTDAWNGITASGTGDLRIIEVA